MVFFAWLSDKVGRRPVYMGGALFSAAFAFPFFWLADTRDPALIALAFIADHGDRRRRDVRPAGGLLRRAVRPAAALFSGFAFARELGSILAGGPSPFIAALLVGWHGGRALGRRVLRHPAVADHRVVGLVRTGDHASDIEAEAVEAVQAVRSVCTVGGMRCAYPPYDVRRRVRL